MGNQARSTCQYSSSTGVLRPKMVTETRSLPRSGSISSTMPFWLWNGAVGDLDGVSDFETDGRADAFLALLDLGEHGVHLALAHRGGAVLGSGEADHAFHLLDEKPGLLDELAVLIGEVHVDDDVTGEEFLLGLGFLAAADLGNHFGGHQHLADVFGHASASRALDPVADLPSWPERTWTTYHWSRKGLVSDMTGRRKK
jgi:hypothetical protein